MEISFESSAIECEGSFQIQQFEELSNCMKLTTNDLNLFNPIGIQVCNRYEKRAISQMHSMYFQIPLVALDI